MSWNFMRKVKINEDRCRKYRNSPALFILCGTGLRLGELLALKWSKVDFEMKSLKYMILTSASNEPKSCLHDLGDCRKNQQPLADGWR